MIRIDRGEEPEALRRARYVHLARAALAHASAQTPLTKDGYQTARGPLHAAQGLKCAYCEMQQQVPSQPVEHFRPKAEAIRDKGHKDPGYWWLAWTWNNLLYACVSCNGAKLSHFPLEAGSVALRPQQAPPGRERPRLIDPSCEDPIEHIQFRLLGHYWRPTPRRGSDRGRETIDRLGLDRGTILDLYNDHVEQVQPILSEVRSALRTEESKLIARAWSRCERRLFGRYRPFQALSYDLLDLAFPAEVRERWQLELRRPGSFGPMRTSQDHAPSGLAALSTTIRLQVRALGERPGAARLPVLEAVRAAKPEWTVGELAAVFEVGEATIETDLEALRAEGER